MQKLSCSKCGTANNAEANFCIQCRHPLSSKEAVLSCPKGHRLDPSWKECPFCRDQHPKTESRQAQVSHGTGAIPAGKNPRFHKQTLLESDLNPPERKTVPTSAPRTAPRETAKRAETRSRQNHPGRLTQLVTPNPGVPIRGEAPIAAVLATFTWHPSGRAFLIREGRTLIGTAEGAGIRLNDPQMSEKHAIIFAREGRVLIDDCLSTNGTYVNGRCIQEKMPLGHGDVIRTGKTLWRFVLIEPPPSG